MARLALLVLVTVVSIALIALVVAIDVWRVIGDDGEKPDPGVKPGP